MDSKVEMETVSGEETMTQQVHQTGEGGVYVHCIDCSQILQFPNIMWVTQFMNLYVS